MLIFIILTFSLLSILYLYFNFEKYQIIFETTSMKAGYHFLFSLKTIPKILKYLFHWNYIFLVITFLILFSLLTIYYYKLVKKNNLGDLIDIYSLETRLFLLGSYILLICYLVFSNYFYREIFLIILFPFLFIITLKGIIDIFLMSFIGSILFLISKKFIYQFKFR